MLKALLWSLTCLAQKINGTSHDRSIDVRGQPHDRRPVQTYATDVASIGIATCLLFR